MARLFFKPPGAELGVARTDADARAVRNGTVQHEVLEGETAVAFASGDSLAVDIDCRIDAGRIDVPVRYGLALSLELGPNARADVHAEVRAGLQAELRARVTAEARSG
jgi:hypothetical protein